MPSKIQLEDLIRQHQAELLELLTVCRGYLPPEELARWSSRLQFLEGLVRLDMDRALKVMRESQRQRVERTDESSPES